MDITKNHLPITLSLFCLSLIFLLPACSKTDEKKAEPKTAAAAASPPKARALPVQGLVVESRALEKSIGATGSLIAYEAVDIRPERTGKLMQLNFNESSFVKKGKLLAKIDDKELQAERKRLEVSLDLAEKEIALVKKGLMEDFDLLHIELLLVLDSFFFG